MPYPKFLDKYLFEQMKDKVQTRYCSRTAPPTCDNLTLGTDGLSPRSEQHNAGRAKPAAKMKLGSSSYSRSPARPAAHCCESRDQRRSTCKSSSEGTPGHAPAAMTLGTYADLFDKDFGVASDALESAAAAQSVGKSLRELDSQKPKRPRIPSCARDSGPSCVACLWRRRGDLNPRSSLTPTLH